MANDIGRGSAGPTGTGIGDMRGTSGGNASVNGPQKVAIGSADRTPLQPGDRGSVTGSGRPSSLRGDAGGKYDGNTPVGEARPVHNVSGELAPSYDQATEAKLFTVIKRMMNENAQSNAPREAYHQLRRRAIAELGLNQVSAESAEFALLPRGERAKAVKFFQQLCDGLDRLLDDTARMREQVDAMAPPPPSVEEQKARVQRALILRNERGIPFQQALELVDRTPVRFTQKRTYADGRARVAAARAYQAEHPGTSLETALHIV